MVITTENVYESELSLTFEVYYEVMHYPCGQTTRCSFPATSKAHGYEVIENWNKNECKARRKGRSHWIYRVLDIRKRSST